MRRFNGIEELRAAVGAQLGHSDWIEITQPDIDLFAQVTGDRQWIHVDPERAAKGPFGTTIAHGFMTLSIIPRMTTQVYRVDGLKMVINYGLEKVRFPSPVPAGSMLRASVEVLSVENVAQGARAVFKIVVERQGSDKPACVAETVTMLMP